MIKDYEMVIGLEVHVELKTETKIFCSCPTAFGAAPNTQTCPVCLGLPGTLPVLNGKVVEYAVKAGLATNCTIARFSKQDRKNYFYPDLPKAYQISQYDLPLCEHGWLDIETVDGAKRIGITRIHIEEDAGKLMHDDEKGTMIDCNRCGVPLIEIVSEPDIRSAEEAKAYLQKLRAIILYTGVSDCKMNEGSLRCDVNLSVRKKGTEAFGTRTEMKNLNSFQFIVKAIEYEYKRQVEAIEAGEKIVQETRRFDASTGKTYSMRTKENANDYRYFPDPDLPPIRLTEEKIQRLQDQIPRLPDQRKKEYMEKYGLSAYDGEVLTTDMAMADYFEKAAAETQYPKLVANMLLSEVMRLAGGEEDVCKIQPERMAALATLSGDGVINSATVKKLIKELWEADFDVAEKVEREGLAQVSDEAVILEWVQEAIRQNPKSVADYQKGKKAAAKAIVGKVMAASGGRANPTVVDRLVEAQLNV
ncbi:MAG: Asp-tRNA(Asn)/Glu-tRNA(Gln) amidotransferase subunit GatB [Clostridiales bacterium]|nr:Asp-tRNA(Asn)/Glu-tRNA(Gln) amidotransferase subunit GatB [Clostridiales bacterium]